jgi:hypothetical protein
MASFIKVVLLGRSQIKSSFVGQLVEDQEPKYPSTAPYYIHAVSFNVDDTALNFLIANGGGRHSFGKWSTF